MRAVPMPGRGFMVGAVIGLFALHAAANGVHNVSLAEPLYMQISFISGGVFAGAIQGAICAAILWTLARGLEGLRVKKPTPWMIQTGRIVYWIGAALGAYFFGMTLYALIFATVERQYNYAAISAITLMAACGLIYWLLARGIRFMLGE
jgi:hypothetical protein